MTTKLQIKIASKLLSTNLVNKVFHSVELIQDKDGIKFPAYSIGGESFDCSPDDSKGMFAYIRQNGAVKNLNLDNKSSDGKLYRMALPLRVVIFNDHEERDFDILRSQLLSIVFLQDVNILSYNSNAAELAKQESPIGDYHFDATTFYFVIDLQVKYWLSESHCSVDNCKVYPNPLTCPVA